MLTKKNLQHIGHSLGFEEVRMCSTEPFKEHDYNLKKRIEKGLYPQEIIRWENALQSHLSTVDPKASDPSAKTIVSLAYHYYSDTPTDLTRPGDPHGVLARAYISDVYGELYRRRDELAEELRGREVKVTITDDLPLKSIAVRAGVGWQGKNSLILNGELGSWMVLQCLLIDQEMEPDEPKENRCRGCTMCLDACPTRAIESPGVIDVNRCIDFLTCKPGIVQKELREVMANRIVSCDKCQEACPYNRRSKISRKCIPRFDPRYRESPALIPLLHMCEEEFIRYYRDCDIIDNSLTSFRRNVITALGNLMDPVALEELERISDDDPVVSETRDWALERINSKRS
jgi:epoxyqueuosine reductase